MINANSVICLMGPTCSGKTDLALQLFERFPIEIISVDSVMVYRGMDIGTAKPAPEILARVPHHLIDIRDPKEIYSAGDFCADAQFLIKKTLQAQKIPLLVGGTMLYFNALQKGLADLPSKDEAVREKLLQRLEQNGLAKLHAELVNIDPVAASRINPNDPQRTLRALEVYEITGKPLSYWWQQAAEPNPYNMINIGLLPDRKLLPARIAQRFQAMLDNGFIDEVKQLYARGDLDENLPAIKSVGYKQVWQYLAGQMDYAAMTEKAIIATRQLAKRQFTWLRSWPNLQIITAEDSQCLEKVSAIINEID